MKKIKIGLLPRIIIAIAAGLLTGLFFPQWLVRIAATFNAIFSNLLQFLIPLIILGLVTPAIADIGKSAGKILLVTVLIAYLDTVFSGCFSYLTSVTIFPHLIDSGQGVDMAERLCLSIFPIITHQHTSNDGGDDFAGAVVHARTGHSLLRLAIYEKDGG